VRTLYTCTSSTTGTIVPVRLSTTVPVVGLDHATWIVWVLWYVVLNSILNTKNLRSVQDDAVVVSNLSVPNDAQTTQSAYEAIYSIVYTMTQVGLISGGRG
jgi:hypothetical protein